MVKGRVARRPKFASKVLVIKLGALGDFMQAIGPFRAIRKFYKNSQIILLTTQAFKSLAFQSGLFDQVWVDSRPNLLDLSSALRLRKKIISFKFDQVFDLQTSDRSSFYFHFLWPSKQPKWSGIAMGCSHRHDNPKRNFLHTLDRQAEQLSLVGIKNIPSPNLDWIQKDKVKFNICGRYFVIFHGGSRHRPGKRWSSKKYIALANHFFEEQKLIPVFLGNQEDGLSISGLDKECPGALNLCGRTTLQEVVNLLRKSQFVIGNDTGPMHISAILGCHSVVLFSTESDPKLCGPRGKNVKILQSENLDQLSLKRVISNVNLLKMH